MTSGTLHTFERLLTLNHRATFTLTAACAKNKSTGVTDYFVRIGSEHLDYVKILRFARPCACEKHLLRA